MTPNKVISKWLGECRHEDIKGRGVGQKGVVAYVCQSCKECSTFKGDYRVPDYENDPAAWTPELFDRIEGEGLDDRFILLLIPNSTWETGKPYPRWHCARSTPAQKAEALSRAITEKEGV
jgi:hypothetical protein